MGPALRGAAVIQGGQGRPPLQSRTGTAQNGTSRTPSPTHSVIARSEATRQSVLPSPKRRIPAPVTRSLARNDSAPRWERRDTWVPPYGVRRSSRADRVVRPYKAEQEPRKTGRRGRRPLHTLSLRGAKRRSNPFSSAQRDGFPRQCVPQGHLLRGAHWLGMTGKRGGVAMWVSPPTKSRGGVCAGRDGERWGKMFTLAALTLGNYYCIIN